MTILTRQEEKEWQKITKKKCPKWHVWVNLQWVKEHRPDPGPGGCRSTPRALCHGSVQRACCTLEMWFWEKGWDIITTKSWSWPWSWYVLPYPSISIHVPNIQTNIDVSPWYPKCIGTPKIRRSSGNLGASRHPRREMRSTGLRVGLLGWAQLLTAAGRNSPWRAALSMLRRREAEGMRLDDVALRKMWLGEPWEIPLF